MCSISEGRSFTSPAPTPVVADSAQVQIGAELDAVMSRAWAVLVHSRTGVRHGLENSAALLGRDADCDLHIEMPTVSSAHAVITRKSGVAFIQDLGSRNGTFVNGQPASGWVELRSGDIVTIAFQEFIFLVNRKSDERGPRTTPL